MENSIPILVNVDFVSLLRRLLDVKGAQNFLNKNGYYFDLLPYLEDQLKTLAPQQNASGIIEYIKSNPVYFFKGDVNEVTKSINNFLMYDPKAYSLFGYPILIYSDPAHLRQYAMYAAGILALIYFLRK